MLFSGFGLILLVLAAVGIGSFYWLLTRERQRSEAGQTRLATWRLVFAAVFGLIALFSGGCSLLFVPSAVRGDQYVDPVVILVIGGVPFAIAALVVWLSLRRGNG